MAARRVAGSGCDTAPEIGDVIHTRGDAGDALVVQRAPLPAQWNGLGKRTHLVRLQARQMLALAVQHAHVRAIELVGGADQKIAIQRSNVDQAVRRVVYRVDVGQRPELCARRTISFTGLMVPTAFEA